MSSDVWHNGFVSFVFDSKVSVAAYGRGDIGEEADAVEPLAHQQLAANRVSSASPSGLGSEQS